jgi:hypothetical protein
MMTTDDHHPRGDNDILIADPRPPRWHERTAHTRRAQCATSLLAAATALRRVAELRFRGARSSCILRIIRGISALSPDKPSMDARHALHQ